MKKNDLLQVKKWNYGNYSTDNYGAHSMALSLGDRTLYFSYETLVAFSGYNSKGKHFYCIHKNEWGTTTGKHLNWIDNNKAIRVDENEFQKQLKEFLR